MQKDNRFDTSVLGFFYKIDKAKTTVGDRMLWYLLIIPATIWAVAIVEPENGGFETVIDDSPVYEKGSDLYQHSDGRLFNNDWANDEEDL